MDRRQSIKTIALGALASGTLLEALGKSPAAPAFESNWHNWPDMLWTGPEYWANRLQDWRIRDGNIECTVNGGNRTLHCLTHRLGRQEGAFETAVAVEQTGLATSRPRGYAGFRLGAKGPFEDFRSAAVFGEGLDAGISSRGHLFIGNTRSPEVVDTNQPVYLLLEGRPEGTGYRLTLQAYRDEQNELLSEITVGEISGEDLRGNIALISDRQDGGDASDQAVARFSGWAIQGQKIVSKPSRTFGPVCFAQYTLHRNTLKLTAQLAPIEAIEDVNITLELKINSSWHPVDESAIDPLARIARFRVEDWTHEEHIPYRIRITVPLRSQSEEFFYEGTVAREPTRREELKMAVFSCNTDHGFPDADVVEHVNKHRPDMAVFLGDQLYEANGGFGVQRTPLDKACLDWLRKWYMFGWSYRDIFRDIPAAVIPDDHDVYHGNVWGEGGKEAPTHQGWGQLAQDAGGYKMSPLWVDMIQRAQTSHLPDPHDPTPVKQGINVYYTDWNYGGVSFAILEDRKFKSAPKNILPAEADIRNGFVRNTEFDIRKYDDPPEAELLGERQREFLKDWCSDWSNGAQMKAVLSQTNFCGAHTLPAGATTDAMVPGLPTPEPGEYVQGDAPALDMDTNGWPQNRRDEVLRLFRKCFAFQVAGDQHLATVVHHGVNEFDDAGYTFTSPALNNIWPRRWWPALESKRRELSDKPAYTGSFFDAFGNHMTVHAAANPHKTGREPAILYDRMTGYGIVTFDPNERTIAIECWPRYADPEAGDAQYADWPITIEQEDNYSREPAAWLPEITVTGLASPVVEIIEEESREIVYTLRISGQTFQPKVFADGQYTVRVGEPDQDRFQERSGIQAAAEPSDDLLFEFR